MAADRDPAAAATPLDAIRPGLPLPPSRTQRWLHRTALFIGWAVGYRRIRHRDQILRAVFPWALTLSIAAPLAAMLDGLIQPVLIGLCAGLLIGGIYAWALVRSTIRQANAELLRREVDLIQYAEDRAASVARQFGWSVDDLLLARRALRDRDTRLEALVAELGGARSLADRRERELAEATQKVFEVGLFDVDRERERLRELELAHAESQAAARRAGEDTAKLRSDVAAATRRIAELSGKLRRISEVTNGAEALRADHEPLTFSWKLEFDGTGDLLRVKIVDQQLTVTKARIFDGPTLVASQPDAIAGDALLDHEGPAGWQSLTVGSAIVDRFRRSDYEGLRFEFLVEDEWLAAVPEAPSPPTNERASGVWSLDGRRAARKAAGAAAAGAAGRGFRALR